MRKPATRLEIGCAPVLAIFDGERDALDGLVLEQIPVRTGAERFEDGLLVVEDGKRDGAHLRSSHGERVDELAAGHARKAEIDERDVHMLSVHEAEACRAVRDGVGQFDSRRELGEGARERLPRWSVVLDEDDANA